MKRRIVMLALFAIVFPLVAQEAKKVAMQLKSPFTFQAYRVLDTIILRGRNGGFANLESPMTAPGGSEAVRTWFDCRRLGVARDEKGTVVVVEQLNVRMDAPASKDRPARRLATFNTNIDVREGQKVVVGKANVDDSGNALILVITAKVVD